MKPAPVKPAISIEVLNQIDIRLGTIRSVADVPGSDKLVQLRVSAIMSAPSLPASSKSVPTQATLKVSKPYSWSTLKRAKCEA